MIHYTYVHVHVMIVSRIPSNVENLYTYVRTYKVLYTISYKKLYFFIIRVNKKYVCVCSTLLNFTRYCML